MEKMRIMLRSRHNVVAMMIDVNKKNLLRRIVLYCFGFIKTVKMRPEDINYYWSIFDGRRAFIELDY